MVRARVESLCQAHISFQIRHKITVVEFVVVELEEGKVRTTPIDRQVDVQTIAQGVQQVWGLDTLGLAPSVKDGEERTSEVTDEY